MNIFIFHRDFRIEDNSGLIALAREEKDIYLLFIVTKEQTANKDFFNPRALQAMFFCLQQLNQKITVNFLRGENEIAVITHLLKNHNINKIYTNKDFTPYANKRSYDLYHLAQEHNITYREFYDYTLFAPHEFKKRDGTFYQVFTPYWNAVCNKQNFPRPQVCPPFNALKLATSINIDINDFESNDFGLPLTRKQILAAINNLPADYAQQRDNISNFKNSTSYLSTAIKFGVFSIREIHHYAYQRFGTFNNSFSRQLMWRDFFYQATYNATISKKWTFGDNWIKKMDNLPWDNNANLFNKWKKGETGILLVDAGMHELNKYGTMHNRVRMVCGSFLVKNLNIDWRWGEKYFAQKLIDYDPIVNQCSWQWIAGTGFDAQQYTRIFNPYLQQAKYDPHFIYINYFLDSQQTLTPIIDVKASAQNAKKRYQQLK